MLTMRMILDGRKAGLSVGQVVQAHRESLPKPAQKTSEKSATPVKTGSKVMVDFLDLEMGGNERQDKHAHFGKRRGTHCWSRGQRHRDGRLRRKRKARARVIS